MNKIHYNTQEHNPSDAIHLKWLRELQVKEVSDLNILDLGCGSGFLCRKFADDGARLAVGVDIELPTIQGEKQDVLLFMEQNLNEVNWGKILAKKVAPHRFDLILAFDIIEHLDSPVNFLRSCQHLLAEGGDLVLTTPNINSWERFLFRNSWSGATDPDHLVLFSRYSLDFLMQKIGLASQKIKAPINKLGPLAAFFPQWGGQILSMSKRK